MSTAAAVAGPVLPTADCGLGPSNNCLTFGDFSVYSLALVNFQQGYGDLHPTDPFYVKSVGSDIAAAIVIGSSDSNAINNQDIPSIAGKVDDAYNTPNHLKSDTTSTNFLMLPSLEPTPTFAGDNAAQGQTTITNPAAPGTGATGPVTAGSLPLWDIQTSALLDYLDGGQMDFFFNLNQTKSATSYLQTPEDMLASMDVIFTNTKLNPGDPGYQVKFRLNGNDCGAGPGSCIPGFQSFAQTTADNILSAPTDMWAYVHGQICVDDFGGVLHFGACTAIDVLGKTIDQNLGAEKAAFALYSQGAQDALESGLYDVMSVDMRMAGVNNGFEQLFIEAGAQTHHVPEPGSITIAGAGLMLIGLSMAWRRRRVLQNLASVSNKKAA